MDGLKSSDPPFNQALGGRLNIGKHILTVRAELCRSTLFQRVNSLSSFHHHCDCLASTDAERGDPLSLAEIVHGYESA